MAFETEMSVLSVSVFPIRFQKLHLLFSHVQIISSRQLTSLPFLVIFVCYRKDFKYSMYREDK